MDTPDQRIANLERQVAALIVHINQITPLVLQTVDLVTIHADALQHILVKNAGTELAADLEKMLADREGTIHD